MTVTVIPQVRVRYNGNCPSLSRRGGIRLHPINDGTAPLGEQLTMLRHRDKLGNKLRDVVDPNSGLCIGVTSPLEGPVSGKGTAGSHTVETRRAAVEKVTVRDHKIYVDEETGFVIRTVDMGNGRRPVAYVKPTTPPAKERRVRKSTGQPDVSGRRVTAPGGTGSGGRITRDDCVAYIKAMAKGRPVEINQYMIENARKVLKVKQAAAAKLLNGGK